MRQTREGMERDAARRLRRAGMKVRRSRLGWHVTRQGNDETEARITGERLIALSIGLVSCPVCGEDMADEGDDSIPCLRCKEEEASDIAGKTYEDL